MATPNLANISTVTPGVLVSQQMSATGDTVVYTVPANKAAKVATMTLTNVSAASVTVSVAIVPAGATVGDGTHKIVAPYPLAANDTTQVSEIVGTWIGDGDRIVVNAGTANAIDVTATGLVFA